MESSAVRWAVAIAWSVLLFTFASNGRLSAQSFAGEILGAVRDSTGAVVPGATVRLTEVSTGASSGVSTNDSRDYLFRQLQPGHYALEISKPGFQTRLCPTSSFSWVSTRVLTSGLRAAR